MNLALLFNDLWPVVITIYFNVQIIPDLVSDNPFKLVSVSFSDVSLILGVVGVFFLNFWNNTEFQIYFILSIPSPGISHVSKDPSLFVFFYWRMIFRNKIWELSELTTFGVLLLLVDSARIMCVYPHAYVHTFTSISIYLPIISSICHLLALFVSVYTENYGFTPISLIPS